ncbi:MAG TPA: hypothetical protein VK588_14180, partial [Chitinophagaceae bacterium]|nr:hypothetical protein [Chitinophagaceae bacterium]
MKTLFEKPKHRTLLFLVSALFIFSLPGCDSGATADSLNAFVSHSQATNAITIPLPDADAAAILNREQVPILCYHQIRSWT